MSGDMFAWAAGILEGEGTFMLVPHKQFKYVECRISCEMNDKDVIEKLYHALQAGNLHDRVRANGKESLSLVISKREDVYRVLNNIRPYMGKRRGHRIDEMISHLNEKGIIPSNPKEIKHALAVNTN